jgi:hypothetical protein
VMETGALNPEISASVADDVELIAEHSHGQAQGWEENLSAAHSGWN